MKQNIKIVIGSNFGDEGKGLATDFFSQSPNTLVVMSNGGAQRGHTVTTNSEVSHIFKHFSSGSFRFADTYFSSFFILNPMTFRTEYKKLFDDVFPKLGLTNKISVFCNQNCRWTTPYDIMVNQIVEEVRDKNRHGSCGMGIWETVNRYNKDVCFPNIFTFNKYEKDVKISMLKAIRDTYFINRLKELGVSSVPLSWVDIFYSDELITNFISDVSFFCSTVFCSNSFIIKKYKNVVFENGQGLLLDADATFYGDNTTPTNTGLTNIVRILESVYSNDELQKLNIEVCYVSRTYMTRHGVGLFVTECKKELLNKDMFDESNVDNEFQGQLRYGELIVENLEKRILSDFSKISFCESAKKSILFTHTNEVGIDIGRLSIDKFNTIYVSNGRTADTVKILK